MITTVVETDVRFESHCYQRDALCVHVYVCVHACAGMVRTVSGQREKVEEVWRLFSDIHGRLKRILKNRRGG